MVRVDLHVHSKYSEHPADWFLQRLGTSESYTDPEVIYRSAKDRGMTFVTITDHNRIDGSLLLREKHPTDTFTGCEVSTYFPEDHCKIHLLVYGLSESDFEEMQKLRDDIYDLRDFLKERNLPHAVAHATSSMNNRLTIEHIEKLILLFDVFEGIDGARSRGPNLVWTRTLAGLTPERIEALQEKHGITPFRPEPWRKGIIGGSNDHAGLFIGTTWTEASCENAKEFLDRLTSKETSAHGRHNDYHSLVFSLYKIAYEFSKSRSSTLSRSVMDGFTGMLFEQKPLSIVDRVKLKALRARNGRSQESTRQLLQDLIEGLTDPAATPLEDRMVLAYDKIASLSDEFVGLILRSAESNLKNGDIPTFLLNLSASLPGVFLSIPFLSSLKHLHKNRALDDEICSHFSTKSLDTGKTILWFTDTMSHLNGVSETLRNVAWLSHRQGHKISIVTCLDKPEETGALPPNVLNLPYVHSYPLPVYENYTMKIPSILRSLGQLYQLEPDEIYVSTPGAIGLLGLLLARLLNIRCVGVYHTDFPAQASAIAPSDHLAHMLEIYTKWFYGAMDGIAVPTNEYINILEKRGFDRHKMSLFHRGVDSNFYRPQADARTWLRETFSVGDGPVLLFAGRISKDKNIDLLIEAHRRLLEYRPDLHLLIVGDGPYLTDIQRSAQKIGGICFTGRLKPEDLARAYSAADVFVLPSATDTFGMVVLEAQSCGLPAIVSDVGGPKEIVLDGKTGFVARAADPDDWVDKIGTSIDLMERQPKIWKSMGEQARKRVIERHDWNEVLRRIVALEASFTDGDRSLKTTTNVI